MTVVAWFRLALVSGVVFSALVGRAAAQDLAPLVFEQKAVTTTCKELNAGLDVAVVNTTASPQDVHVRLEPAAQSDVDFGQACGDGVKPTFPSLVQPGDSFAISLKASSAAAIEEPATGDLVVFAGAGLVSRLPVQIVNDETAGQGPPVPLVDSASGTQYLGNREDDTPLYVPVDLGESKTADLPKGATVGGVSGDADRAPVTYVGTFLIDGTTMVGLDADGLRAGKYTGSADLVPGDDAGDVSLTLTVKDAWPWALAALALGVLISFLAQRSAGYWVPRYKLKAKAGELATTYERAAERLRAAPGDGRWEESTISDVATAIKATKDEIDVRFKGVYISADQKVIEALEGLIGALAGLIGRFGDLAIRLPKLQLLVTELETRPTPLPPRVELPSELAFVTRARLRLQKHELALEGWPVELAAVEDCLVALPKVTRLERYLSQLYRDALELHGRLEEGVDEGDRVEALIARLTGIQRQLWRTDEVARLDQLAARLTEVDDHLSDLLAPSAERLAARDALVESADEDLTGLLESADIIYLAHDGRLRRIVDDARDDATRARWLERGALVLGLTVAFVTGMTAIYIGKPFGTVWDYITAITWGLVTPTALVAAVAALDKIGALTALRNRLG